MGDFYFLENNEALNAFVVGFQNGTLPRGAFGHAGHVAVAACYCLKFEPADCLNHFRHDLKHFNESVGGANTEDSGYHETLTVFWLDAIREFLGGKSVSALEAARLTVQAYAKQPGLPQTHYSFDLLKSREARARYIKPDSKQS